MKFYNYFYDRQLKYQELPRMCEELDINPRELGLERDELLVLYYMFCYIFITNRECREEIGFGKTKSAKIFKKLVELGLVDKHGAGAGTYYMLKIEGYTGEEEKNKEVGMKASENGK